MIERNAGVATDKRVDFRVGIHLGDVVEEADGDLMGDGVNIAARLEAIAAPGAISLSEDAYRQVKGRLELAVTDLGRMQLTPWGAQNDLIGDIYNTREEKDPRGQYLAVEWSEAEKNIDPDTAFDFKRGKKGEDDDLSIKDWLIDFLNSGPKPIEDVRQAALTRNYNWGSVIAKRGKHPEIFATESTKTYPKSQIWRLV